MTLNTRRSTPFYSDTRSGSKIDGLDTAFCQHFSKVPFRLAKINATSSDYPHHHPAPSTPRPVGDRHLVRSHYLRAQTSSKPCPNPAQGRGSPREVPGGHLENPGTSSGPPEPPRGLRGAPGGPREPPETTNYSMLRNNASGA